MTVKSIEKSILQLSPIQRLRMVDNILASLDKPDPSIERAWGRESDRRLAAYRRGEITAIEGATVMRELRGRCVA